MFRQSSRVAGACSLVVAMSSFYGSGAYAADLPPRDALPAYYYSGDDLWTRPYLLGDLGRTRLKQQGIDLSASIVDEVAANLSGGTKTGGANAGQLAVQAKFDMAKLAGLTGGTFTVTLVDRWGRNLNADDNIPALMLTNEVFGRGNIVRLEEFSYSQKLFNDRIEVKGGRLAVGTDFFFGNCDFMNLTFCGGQPGNIAGGYIYNWPISQWGGVVKANLSKDLQLAVGFYDSNPNYLTTKPNIALLPGFPDDAPTAGLLVPVEASWKPTLNGLPGVYKVGGWYNDAVVSNVATDGHGHLTLDGPFGKVNGRYGGYVSIVQQLTSPGGYKDAVDPNHGLFTFFNASVGDQQTSFQDYQVSWGLWQVGTFASRPDDSIGFAVGTTHVNSRVADAQALVGAAVQKNEYAVEAWYGWQATPWLNLKFDFQYVINPGGFSNSAFIPGTTTKNDDAAVVGLRSTVKF